MKIQNKQKNRERKKNGDPWNQKIMGSYKYFSKIFIKKTLVLVNWMIEIIMTLAKGQLILKANFQAEDSSKKRTNEFVFTIVCDVFSFIFLEESLGLTIYFRNHLTFNKWLQKSRISYLMHFTSLLGLQKETSYLWLRLRPYFLEWEIRLWSYSALKLFENSFLDALYILLALLRWFFLPE